MANSPEAFVRNPSADFTRDRMLNFENTVNLILSMGSASINRELLDFFQYVSPSVPSASAFVQQRAKILPDAFRTLFLRFNSCFAESPSFNGFRLLACDGTDLDFYGNPADAEYYFILGNASVGCCTIHVNALYSLCSKRYVDAVIQPCHGKDDFRAFCDMVGRTPQQDAHVTLVRRRIPQVRSDPETRFVWKGCSFDFLAYGAEGTYEMSLRVVCISLPGGAYEYLVTNLPADKFPPDTLKELYYRRWGVETSFRELKYAVGLSAFHCRKPDFVIQEIWARLTLYNFCELITSHVAVEQKNTKHVYQLNYTMAIQICHNFLRILPSTYQPDVETLIGRYLLPVRKERNYKRKVKPRHAVSFLYRMA